MAKKILPAPQSVAPEKPKVDSATVYLVRNELENVAKHLSALSDLTKIIERIGGETGNCVAGAFDTFIEHVRRVISEQHEVLGAVEEEFKAALQAKS